MKDRFSFPCREKNYDTKEGRKAINLFINDKIGDGKLLNVIKERFTANGEKWINFTITFEKK